MRTVGYYLQRDSSGGKAGHRNRMVSTSCDGRASSIDVRLLVTPSAEHIMAMPAEARRRWTAKAVRELMEKEPLHWPRYELVDGELLVSPSPRMEHHRALWWLVRVLDEYVQREQLGLIGMAPADLELEPETIVQPDAFVIPLEEEVRARVWTDVHCLSLVIEVLSPSTAADDRGPKREHYQRNRVPEYWIVDLDSRLIERWRPNDERPEILREQLVWHPAGAQSPFEIALKDLWTAARLD